MWNLLQIKPPPEGLDRRFRGKGFIVCGLPTPHPSCPVVTEATEKQKGITELLAQQRNQASFSWLTLGVASPTQPMPGWGWGGLP